MRLDTYHHLLSELGRRHKAITASPENGRFLRIFISADPVQKQIDLINFQGATRSELKAPAGQAYLVAENYQVDYGDNQGDYLSREFRGAYLVLQRADRNNYAQRDAAVAKCETVAEQLLAALVEQLREEHDALISVRDAWLEHLGPLADTSVGVRMNFTWSESAGEDLVYDETHFTA
ncbi:MAG: hypothetical protein ACRYF0_07825 [Janthinobacterium lividum]